MPYKNKADLIAYRIKYKKLNNEKLLAYAAKRRLDPEYRKKKRISSKIYREKNQAKIKQYRKDHALDRLRDIKKNNAYLGDIHNMSGTMYKYANVNWARFIKKSGKCAYCESTDTLNAHHILSKSKFPSLALSENNGIPLCVTCHSTHHSLNGATA